MAGLSWISIAVMVMVSLIEVRVGRTHLLSGVVKLDMRPTFRNCRDVQREGNSNSGIYTIYPYDCCPERPVEVYCDMETDGGGWTIIQRRDDIQPRENFFRTWMEYALGFGNLKGEFWLGNDHIHALTDQALNQVRFDLADFESNTRWAKYKFFYVHDQSLDYKMEANGYTGDAGDSFTQRQAGQLFSTKDKDLDTAPGDENCAAKYKGGWWYGSCHYSNLNGLYLRGANTAYAQGINWYHWLGDRYSLKKTEIKIRPSY